MNIESWTNTEQCKKITEKYFNVVACHCIINKGPNRNIIHQVSEILLFTKVKHKVHRKILANLDTSAVNCPPSMFTKQK